MAILKNKARCRLCNDTIESKYRHHLVFCKCKAIFVDGGKEYLRRGGEMKNIVELSEQDKKILFPEDLIDV